MPHSGRVPLFTDAEASWKAAHNPSMHQLTKHFSVKYHWIRSHVDPDTGHIHLIWTSKLNNESDLLTQSLLLISLCLLCLFISII